MDLGLVGSSLVGRCLPGVSLFASSLFATAMPAPLFPSTHGEAGSPWEGFAADLHPLRPVCRKCLGGSAQRDRAPRLLPRGARGEAPESGWIFRIYPWKGAIGKNKREGMRSEISRDGRMNSGWSATSPYVRLLRCLYSMQRLCLKWGDLGHPRRISSLRGGLPVFPPARTPALPLRSCNCFLSLMAFLQIYRVFP